jgi:sporulation-control protein spo0M
VVFDLPINEDTQLSLVQDVRITGAYIYLNNTAVSTDLTLPAKTPLQVNLNLTIPVSTTVPVNITVPVTLQIPVDIAIDQTDLHQSIVGLQEAIEPYKTVMESAFNSPKDFSICNLWWSGWMCSIFFGK